MGNQTSRSRIRLGPCRPGVVAVAVFCGAAAAVGCTEDRSTGLNSGPLWELAECTLTPEYVQDGGIGLDGLPSISSPEFVAAEPQAVNEYVEDADRVLGIVVDGQAMAVPLGALWYHEIVNLDVGPTQLALTHGGLSGSSRVYDRSGAGGETFGVSGFLYRNNLLFYDRGQDPSLWGQMTGEGYCGPLLGTQLSPYAFLEVTWEGWKTLHPTTTVLSLLSGSGAPWGEYPYGGYEDSPDFYFPNTMPTLDPRRPPKERVLGIPDEAQGGLAFPFGPLEDEGDVSVAQGELADGDVVVFWRSDLQGAAAYWNDVDGEALTFTAQSGAVVDAEYGTTWDFLGRGTGGGLDGFHLQPVSRATVAYWGAWAAFYPDTELWSGGG
jgi:hypothetical protein